jgi:hypothetical protein
LPSYPPDFEIVLGSNHSEAFHLSLDNKDSPVIFTEKNNLMKSLIRHKQIYYILLTLHVLFLSMPVCHAGKIVLCYSDAGHIKIELKLSDECSSCNKSGSDSQEKDPCFCLDIPISKQVDTHAALVSNGTVQPQPQSCFQSFSAREFNLFFLDSSSILSYHSNCKNPVHESLRSTVLLI